MSKNKSIFRKKKTRYSNTFSRFIETKINETDIEKSIDLNIIGTANITKACSKKNQISIFFYKLCIPQDQEAIIKSPIQFFQ